MSTHSYILAIDQGTTSSRSILFNARRELCALSQQETKQIYPKHGWVEQDPEDIYQTQQSTYLEVLKKQNIEPQQIVGVGITNQRETTILWDKHTGKPIYNAIVWQDTRTSTICQHLKDQGHEPLITRKTGLVLNSYFSATKVQWILDHVPNARTKADNGDILFGTIDTWLLWQFTQGKVHATDYSNASRTLLFNIHSLDWDNELLDLFNIPKAILPEVKPSCAPYGFLNLNGTDIPIYGMIGDQQSALFGQACFKKGQAKNTYGTGCFLLMNTGKKAEISEKGLLTTIAWGINNDVFYALEGSVFIAGAAIQWLRDEIQILDHASQSETMAIAENEDSAVYVVPAFSGLGAPYWNMNARGAIFGLTRDTNKNQLVKATLESIAYRTKDLILAMQTDAKISIKSLHVDGGAAANNFLMQFQANLLDAEVRRATILESTALGAAFLAGIGAGLWTQDDLSQQKKFEATFTPQINEEKRQSLYKKWLKAIKRTMDWED